MEEKNKTFYSTKILLSSHGFSQQKRKKSKVLQKFITKIYNLVFCHYSGVLNTWVDIMNININKF